jgi:serine/threonine protein kinase
MGDLIGHLLGNYRLVRYLGKGGQASVYLGEHRYLRSYAALKVPHAAAKKADEHRFLSEAQTPYRYRFFGLSQPKVSYAEALGVSAFAVVVAPSGDFFASLATA